MFTGLVQDVGFIKGLERCGELLRLTIHSRILEESPQLGESVCVDGVCLTVVSLGSETFQVEVSPETLGRTTLGEAQPGRAVNLERALRISDRLGGHLVTGHVDAVGVLKRKQTANRYLELEIGVPSQLGRYLVEKGSIAVDGISLTINRCGKDWFGLTLIPHTISKTALAAKGVGARVNVECDILGKYVEKLLEAQTGNSPQKEPAGITQELLQKHGYLS